MREMNAPGAAPPPSPVRWGSLPCAACVTGVHLDCEVKFWMLLDSDLGREELASRRGVVNKRKTLRKWKQDCVWGVIPHILQVFLLLKDRDKGY